MFNFNKHNSKTDRYARSHKTDLGYELGTALAVDASDGRPLGPLEFRLRTANGMLSTRIGGATLPPGHIDEIADCMAQDWQLARTPIHIIDREADSVGHYRRWHAANHHFVVRANGDRVVQHNDCEKTLSEAAADLSGTFVNVLDSAGQPGEVTIRAGTGVVQVAESAVILHRPARRYTGKRTAKGVKKQIGIPGVPLPLRLVVTRVMDKNDKDKILAEWFLLTNAETRKASMAMIGQWYAWRWSIESYHKLLKTAGMNAEAWQQENGEAFLRRLCVASMACLTVWHLQRDKTPAAGKLRQVLVRLSGRLMQHRVESTAPALLAGLERLLAIDDLMQVEDIEEILGLARQLLPKLFPNRSG
ncbi:MAG: hypothetical protein ACKO0V_18515 [bacterium]